MEQAAAQTATASPQGDSQHFQSLDAAYEGCLQQSRQASIQAVTLARQAHLAERAALFAGAAAAEFRRMLDHPGHLLADPIGWPPASNWLARPTRCR